MSAKIKIKINKKGELEVDVGGVTGATCENLTAALIQGIGEVEEQCLKNEWSDQESPEFVHSQGE